MRRIFLVVRARARDTEFLRSLQRSFSGHNKQSFVAVDGHKMKFLLVQNNSETVCITPEILHDMAAKRASIAAATRSGGSECQAARCKLAEHFDLLLLQRINSNFANPTTLISFLQNAKLGIMARTLQSTII